MLLVTSDGKKFFWSVTASPWFGFKELFPFLPYQANDNYKPLGVA